MMDDLDFDYYDDMKFNDYNDYKEDFYEEDINYEDFGSEPFIDKDNKATQLDANKPSFFKRAINFIANSFVFVGAVIGSFVRAVIFGDRFTTEVESSIKNFDKANQVRDKIKENKHKNVNEETVEEEVEKSNDALSQKKRNEISEKLCNDKFDIFRELGIDAEIKASNKMVYKDKLVTDPSLNVTFFDKFRNPKNNFIINGNTVNNFTDTTIQIMNTQPFVHNESLISKNGNTFVPKLEQEAFINAALKSSMVQAAITITSSNKDKGLISSLKVSEYTEHGIAKEGYLKLYLSNENDKGENTDNKIIFRYKDRDIASIKTEDLLRESDIHSGYLLSKIDEISKTMYLMMKKEDVNYIKEYSKANNIDTSKLEELKQRKVDVVTEQMINEKKENQEQMKSNDCFSESDNEIKSTDEKEEANEFTIEDIMEEPNPSSEDSKTEPEEDIPNIEVEATEMEEEITNTESSKFEEAVPDINELAAGVEEELNEEKSLINENIEHEENYENVEEIENDMINIEDDLEL